VSICVYLGLNRSDGTYQTTDIERSTDFVRDREVCWKEAFVYFKREESGIGPKLSQQMVKLLA